MILCACGCGRPTTIASQTSRRYGVVKGESRRYLAGHNAKNIPVKGYRSQRVNGVKAFIHRAKAEAALGKPLPAGAIVHHVDGFTNAQSALVICENQAYHLFLHHRTRIVRAGGNPNTDKICGTCKQAKPLGAFNIDRQRLQGRGPSCRECLAILWPAKAEIKRTKLGAKRRLYG